MEPVIEAKFVSRRGNNVIIVSHYKFSEFRTMKDGSISFRCCNRACNATVCTDETVSKVVSTRNGHEHEPQSDLDIEREEVRSRLKLKAVEDLHSKPQKLLSEALRAKSAIFSESDIRSLRESVNHRRRALRASGVQGLKECPTVKTGQCSTDSYQSEEENNHCQLDVYDPLSSMQCVFVKEEPQDHDYPGMSSQDDDEIPVTVNNGLGSLGETAEPSPTHSRATEEYQADTQQSKRQKPNSTAEFSDQRGTLFEVKRQRDECDIFGEFVATKLRALKYDYSRNQVEHLISSLLFEASLGKFDPPSE